MSAFPIMAARFSALCRFTGTGNELIEIQMSSWPHQARLCHAGGSAIAIKQKCHEPLSSNRLSVLAQCGLFINGLAQKAGQRNLPRVAIQRVCGLPEIDPIE